MHRYRITCIDKNGNTVTKTVTARNTFEATQLAGAFNCQVLSFEDLDQ